MVHGVYVYFMDEFKPADISVDKLRNVKVNPSELAGFVREVVENEVGVVHDVYLYGYYEDNDVLVAEYIARTSTGEFSVKIIHADNPVKALEKYYESENKSKIAVSNA